MEETATTSKSKAKKITGIVVNVILWLFVIFAVLITIVVASANSNAKNVTEIGGKCYLSVLSDSMNAEKPSDVAADKPSGFKKGDMLISKYIAEDDDAINALEVGDIITFEWDIDGDGMLSKGEYNTHRIISIDKSESGEVVNVTTRGDNADYGSGSQTVGRSAVIALYTGKKIGGLGSVFTFLSSSTGFLVCILLPMAIFFIYEAVVFTKTLLSVKNEGKKVISAADEEAIKQRAIEEYLRREQEKAALNAETAENTDKPQENLENEENDGGEGEND